MEAKTLFGTLPPGTIVQVVKRTGLSGSTVYNYLKGRRKVKVQHEQLIIETLSEILEELKQAQEKIKDVIYER